MITMIDDGYMDTKIIAIPFKDPSWNVYHDIAELPPHIMDEISHFFMVYKNLEGKETAVVKVESAEIARQAISEAIAAYKAKFSKKQS